jgi:hypothetical protein
MFQVSCTEFTDSSRRFMKPPPQFTKPPTSTRWDGVGSRSRISLRLRPDDIHLLRERATGQQLSMSSWAGSIVRTHVQGRTPIPNAENAVLKLSIAEVTAIGRELNEMGRGLNTGERNAGLTVPIAGIYGPWSTTNPLIPWRDIGNIPSSSRAHFDVELGCMAHRPVRASASRKEKYAASP